MASSDSAPALSPLSFPPATFAKLTPAPYLLAHLQPSSASSPPTRPSGRSPAQHRQLAIHTSSLSHASGSATARLGGTSVVVGIRAEILYARDIPGSSISTSAASAAPGLSHNSRGDSYEPAQLGLLVPNVELATGSSPAHLPGSPPSTIAQSLTHRVHELLHATRVVNAEQLRIRARLPTGEEDGDDDEVIVAYWALYIDVLFISLDGGALSTAWSAILAALGSTTLPRAEWDADNERVVCSARREDGRAMVPTTWPTVSEYGVFDTSSRIRGETGKRWVLSDPDAFEEDACREQLTVVVDEHSKILRIDKAGGVEVGTQHLRELVADALKTGAEWRKVIEDAIKV